MFKKIDGPVYKINYMFTGDYSVIEMDGGYEWDGFFFDAAPTEGSQGYLRGEPPGKWFTDLDDAKDAAKKWAGYRINMLREEIEKCVSRAESANVLANAAYVAEVQSRSKKG